tara:strand:- start:911 stop:1192 length:282 start_codon:yes stop_codon:yes gene_type:complete
MFVFFILDNKFIVKFFWPHRTDAKGFSIKNLLHKNPEKIASASVSSNKKSNQLLEDKNLISIQEDSKNLRLTHISIKRKHWANRDFSEYREAA